MTMATTSIVSGSIPGGSLLEPHELRSTKCNSFGNALRLPYQKKSNQTQINRKLSVHAEYKDRRGEGGDFVAGFLFGGEVFGTLACSYAPRRAPRSKKASTLHLGLVPLGAPLVFNNTSLSSSLRLRQPLKSIPALDSRAEGVPHHQRSEESKKKSLKQWDMLTAKFAGAANLPFLLLQLPQILLNARNLLAGNKTALLAVPWLGMFTGLLGNLSLLSYFAKKREAEAVVVQTLGVISTYVVLAQLAMAEAMPLPHFIVTSIVVASGLLLNFTNYFGFLSASIWRFWEDFITVAGLSVLPQVMWSTFVPYIPSSVLPGTVAFVIAVVAIVMVRLGKLSGEGIKFVGSISGWTATLLFMWMPVAQMWTNFLNPDNIKGLSAVSMLLAMIGNGLMIPRALFIRDLMWFTGSTWASVFYGWGNLICMYCLNSISKGFFFAATSGLFIWIGTALWRDTKVYGYSSPMTSIKELVSGV